MLKQSLFLLLLFFALQPPVSCQKSIYFINETRRPILIQKRTLLETGAFPYALSTDPYKVQEIPIATTDPLVLNVVVVPNEGPYGTAYGIYYLFVPNDTVRITATTNGQPFLTHIRSAKRTKQLSFAFDLLKQAKTNPPYTLQATNPALFKILNSRSIPLKQRNALIDSLLWPHLSAVNKCALEHDLDTALLTCTTSI